MLLFIFNWSESKFAIHPIIYFFIPMRWLPKAPHPFFSCSAPLRQILERFVATSPFLAHLGRSPPCLFPCVCRTKPRPWVTWTRESRRCKNAACRFCPWVCAGSPSRGCCPSRPCANSTRMRYLFKWDLRKTFHCLARPVAGRVETNSLLRIVCSPPLCFFSCSTHRSDFIFISPFTFTLSSTRSNPRSWTKHSWFYSASHSHWVSSIRIFATYLIYSNPFWGEAELIFWGRYTKAKRIRAPWDLDTSCICQTSRWSHVLVWCVPTVVWGLN